MTCHETQKSNLTNYCYSTFSYVVIHTLLYTRCVHILVSVLSFPSQFTCKNSWVFIYYSVYCTQRWGETFSAHQTRAAPAIGKRLNCVRRISNLHGKPITKLSATCKRNWRKQLYTPITKIMTYTLPLIHSLFTNERDIEVTFL